MSTKSRRPLDFIRVIVEADAASDKYGGQVQTRFPPEPNGYPHFGHAKAICVNFAIAGESGGQCNLRFDDTNPETESLEYVDAFIRDIRWLGFEPDRVLYASDYFEQFYDFAVRLIQKGRAYVCDLDDEGIRAHRGSISETGRESPWRTRTVAENLDLFSRMRAGEFPDGSRTLRAKIDMTSPNMKMRDPLLYRIRHHDHYRRGDAWCIYPMYDYAHCLEDAIEGVTHSICTLEFENNREVYDWILRELDFDPAPQQLEMARLDLTFTVLSKRWLLRLVNDGRVRGWDDPRMPTLSGLRRRGVSPEAIRAFIDDAGIAKTNSKTEIERFDHFIRDDLNHTARRVMAVLRPLEVELTTWPEGEVDEIEAPYWPADVGHEGSRFVPFTRRIFIEQDDFAEVPPKGFRRLVPGGEVRLRYGYVVRCDEVMHDERGQVVGLRCSHDPATRGGNTPDGRKVKGTIHWVSAERSLPAEVRLYERLFARPEPDVGDDLLAQLARESETVVASARVEPSVGEDTPDTRYQFERLGYFWRDPVDCRPDHLVFNRIIALKESWSAPVPVVATPESIEEAPTEKIDNRVAVSQRPDEPAAAGRFDRLVTEGLSDDDARVLALNPGLLELFDQAGARAATGALIANVLAPLLSGPAPFSGAEIGRLVELIENGTLTHALARQVLAEMVQTGHGPDAVIESRGLRRVGDSGELSAAIDRVFAENPAEAERFRGGDDRLQGFFVGKVMRATGGQADAAMVGRLLRERR